MTENLLAVCRFFQPLSYPEAFLDKSDFLHLWTCFNDVQLLKQVKFGYSYIGEIERFIGMSNVTRKTRATQYQMVATMVYTN